MGEDTINDRVYYYTTDSSLDPDLALWFNTERNWCLGNLTDL